jgi:hypothetical protein
MSAPSEIKNIASSQPEILHDRSRVMGILLSILKEKDCRIAHIGNRHVVLPLDPDLSKFMLKTVVLMMNREQCLVRLAGHDILGVQQ